MSGQNRSLKGQNIGRASTFVKTSFVSLLIGVRAPLDLGGGDLIARKKLHNARNHVLYSNDSNNKNAPISYV